MMNLELKKTLNKMQYSFIVVQERLCCLPPNRVALQYVCSSDLYSHSLLLDAEINYRRLWEETHVRIHLLGKSKKLRTAGC